MDIDPTVDTDTLGNDSVNTDDGVDLIEEELLVEEISIDGMCGVY